MWQRAVAAAAVVAAAAAVAEASAPTSFGGNASALSSSSKLRYRFGRDSPALSAFDCRPLEFELLGRSQTRRQHCGTERRKGDARLPLRKSACQD